MCVPWSSLGPCMHRSGVPRRERDAGGKEGIGSRVDEARGFQSPTTPTCACGRRDSTGSPFYDGTGVGAGLCLCCAWRTHCVPGPPLVARRHCGRAASSPCSRRSPGPAAAATGAVDTSRSTGSLTWTTSNSLCASTSSRPCPPAAAARERQPGRHRARLRGSPSRSIRPRP